MEPHPYTDLPHLDRCSEWVIAFTPYRGRNLLKKWLLSPACGHVWAFTEVHGNTLIFDPFSGGYFTAVTSAPTSESGLGVTPAILAKALLRKGQVQLLYYKARMPRTSAHWGTVVPSCVSMVKLLLGVRSWVFTPRQLHKKLIQRGAAPLTGRTLETFLLADKTRRSAAILNKL